MAGEYFVAAQLQRLGVSASVTYGNAKSADVIAFVEHSDRVVVIEVKTTRQNQWVVGSKTPPKSFKPWVFVNIPDDGIEAPCFYVLSQSQLHDIVFPLEEAYFERYRKKHGAEYGDKPGVVNVNRKLLEKYKDCWQAIIDQMEYPPRATSVGQESPGRAGKPE